MKIAKRIFLFFAVNILIITTITIVTSALGLQPYLQKNGINYSSLIVFCLIWGFGGAFISLALSKVMAKWMMGLKIIDPSTQDHQLRRIVKAVHDYSQKAGIRKMPEVAYYESDELNAFATGPTKNNSLVAVSTGLLSKMSEDEVDGVLAHEVAHIANGDMVTMTLIQGVVNTFVIFISRILAQLAAGFMGGNRDEGEESNGNPLIYFAVATVLELVFGILASIITMWFSRHREFHADAGSAKLVGREKMIAALQRLKTSYEPQEATSMMAFCINGKSKSLSELFMTHPPLDKRIEALRTGEYLK